MIIVIVLSCQVLSTVGFVGDDAAKQIEDIIKNASVADKGAIAATIVIITLLIGATSIFGEIQDSINDIWGLF